MKRILVVEDDSAIRRSLEKALTNSGFLVVEAANGREAIAAYDPGKIDAVVLDIIMPDVEGLETLRALRHICPAVKVLAMSGGGQICAEDHLAVARKLGAQRSIEKPFLASAFLALLNDLLGIHSPQASSGSRSSANGRPSESGS